MDVSQVRHINVGVYFICVCGVVVEGAPQFAWKIQKNGNLVLAGLAPGTYFRRKS